MQLDPTAEPQVLADLATEALAWAAALPKKGKRPKK